MTKQKSLFDDLKAEEVEKDLIYVDPTYIEVSDLIQPTDEFIKSVREHGVLQPVLLRKLPDNALVEGRYRVIAGRRRVTAAKIVGLEKVPALIHNTQSVIYDAAMSLEAQALHSDNPIADFRAIVLLIDEGYTKESITSALGVSTDRIDKLLRLGMVSNSILDAIEDETVALGTALSMAKLGDVYRERLEEKFKREGKLTGKDVRQVKQVKAKKASGAVFEAIADQEKNTYQSPLEKIEELLCSSASLGNSEYEKGWNEALEKVLEVLS